MISDVFIDRPRLSIVISVVISLAGLIAITQIPVAQFPDIVPPQVSVTAAYPGASAEEVISASRQSRARAACLSGSGALISSGAPANNRPRVPISCSQPGLRWCWRSSARGVATAGPLFSSPPC